MATIYKQRMSALADDEFVVFLIGMRMNKPWKVHKWLPVANAMTRMLKELYQHPELGLISHEQWFGRTTIMIQYWKSFEHLESYAKNKDSEHLPAWKAFNQKVGSNGDVGIWHETYVSRKGDHECVYNNMPRFGLAKAFEHIEAKGHYKSAKSRMNT
jgi:hypothetical protein